MEIEDKSRKRKEVDAENETNSNDDLQIVEEISNSNASPKTPRNAFALLKSAKQNPKSKKQKSSDKSPKSKSSQPKSRFTDCPKCGASVIIHFINEHMDSGCPTKPKSSSQSPLPNPDPPKEVKLIQLLPQPASAFEVIKKKKKTAIIHFYETFRLFTAPNTCINWKWTNSTANSTIDKANEPNTEENSEKVPDDNKVSWRHEFSLKILKKHIAVTLTTNHTFEEGGTVDWKSHDLLYNQPKQGTCYLPISILKSMLQKNIRMSRPLASVRIALHLLKEDFVQFIRRLSIIVLEDGILHPALPFLFWLTAAASAQQFVPTELHINICLQIVYEIAAVGVRDVYDPEGEYVEDDEESDKENAETQPTNPTSSFPSLNEINSLPPEESCIIKSILGRASYGGMAGDLKMLKYFAATWYKRFNVKSADSLPESLKPFVSDSNNKRSLWLTCLIGLYESVHKSFSYKEVGHIVPDDCLLSGVDFHCSAVLDVLMVKPEFRRNVENFLCKEYGDNVDLFGKLQSVMWLFRSSTNKKEPLYPYVDRAAAERERLTPLWNIVKSDFDAFALGLIRKKFS